MAVVISSDLVLSETLTTSLKHGRIGYKKISGTVTASTEDSGYSAIFADNELTYSFWKPTDAPTSATWEISLITAEDVNYFGIAAHTLGTDGVQIDAEYWNGSSWVTIDSTLPADDSPIMFIFTTVFSSKYRIKVTGSTNPRIGVIYIGTLLEMERGIYGGHSPITLSRKTVLRPNSSERGQWLGRSIIRSGNSTQYSWKNLTAAWYRANFDAFVEHARTKPFFIAWNPQSYPDEVAYVWTSVDIKPSNNGRRDLMDVDVQVEGLGIE